MAVTLFPDGVPCALQEAFDLSFLRQWGKVFRVFDQQDSGNLCFGLEDGAHRYFVKFAGARPVRYKGGPERAVELLKQSGRVYRDLAHPVLLPLLWEGPVEGGYALLFPWTEAICMGKQYPSRERFLALPLGTKLGIYREVLAFHSHVAKRGMCPWTFTTAACSLRRPQAARSSATWTPTTGCPSSTLWAGCGAPPGLWRRRSLKRARPSMKALWCTRWAPLPLSCSPQRAGSLPSGPSPLPLGRAPKKRPLPNGRTAFRMWRRIYGDGKMPSGRCPLSAKHEKTA